MRRLLLFGLLAALLAAPAARAASITTRIVQDCSDDSVLEGHYTVAQLRTALRHLPTDVAEYSDCSDVLTRAIDAATAASGAPPAASQPAQTGTATPAPAGPSNNTPHATATPTPRPALEPLATGAVTSHDKLALGTAMHDARGQPVDVGGKRVAPGRLVAAILPPTTLLVVLILLAACTLAVGVPYVRRVLAHRRR